MVVFGPNTVVDLWHVSHPAVVGIWPVPIGFGVTPANAVPVALAAWQVRHPVVIPVWFITPEPGPMLLLA
jgi:hypothetical protein